MTIRERRAREIRKIERAYLTDLVDGICDGCGQQGKIARTEGICTQCTQTAIYEIENGDLDALLD